MHTSTVTGVALGGTALDLRGADPLSLLTLGAVDQNADSVGWSFALDDTPFIDLGEGEVATLTYTVELRDSAAVTASGEMVITVTGTKDAPRCKPRFRHGDRGRDYPDGTPEPGVPTVSGNVLDNDTDTDLRDTLVVTEVACRPGDVGEIVQGDLGAVVINTNGSYSYTLDNALDATKVLAVSDTGTENFLCGISDGVSLRDSFASLTITLTGTNDAPVANP